MLITCFFFLCTFCKHCMQKKCYDLRSLLYCKLHHTTSFPFFSPLPNQPSIFATSRASLQPTDRKFEKVFLDERHCVDEGFVASRPTWNLMKRKLLWKATDAANRTEYSTLQCIPGPRKAREAQKHFGAAGRPGSHVKPFVRSRSVVCAEEC